MDLGGDDYGLNRLYDDIRCGHCIAVRHAVHSGDFDIMNIYRQVIAGILQIAPKTRAAGFNALRVIIGSLISLALPAAHIYGKGV
ncbi:MAG: hypothetical protein BWY13_00742 [Euryarchaeota archaeon ADurb.Bin190]|nr:MAG: hypothetical protein BWY13_00742 [Euryarchaeota archaeon ADurb.Bin190]